MKLLVQSVNREFFVKQRYQKFLKKKEFLESVGLYPDNCVLSDLDATTEFGFPLKDLVVCDNCNENITEPSFIMLEGQKVYHFACCKERPELPSNVVSLVPRKEET